MVITSFAQSPEGMPPCGIHEPDDAVTAIKLGANVVMMTSAIYRHGARIVERVRTAIAQEIQDRSLLSVGELVGSKRSGYRPFPESDRREQYSASIVELSSELGRAKGD